MLKIVMVALCVLGLVGMLAIDFFISRDMNHPAKKKDESEEDEHEKD